MKRRELIKRFEKGGWYLLRNGGRHDVYTNGEDIEEIPRHPDIKERLAKNLIKKWGL
ncbi:MAG: type II toxin-antitoxin system HicA family toxin [Roseburia sp.]|nr:type II toxin-antitoxin system HicA family toxin [Roseburia sp.]